MTIDFVTNMKKVYSSGNLGLVPRIIDSVDDKNCTERIWLGAEHSISNVLGTYSLNTVESPPAEKRYCNINEAIGTENLLKLKSKAFSETVDVISHVADFVKAMKGNVTDRGDVGYVGPSFCVEERPSSTHESGADALRSLICSDDVKSLPGINMLALDDEPQAADEFEDSEMCEINDSVANYSLHGARHHSQDEEIACGERGKLTSACKVCGDHATGMYFGALVCVPCKTFFLRYAGEGHSFVCKGSGDCQISTSTRTQCKFCRYQKCLQAGMHRRVRPAQVKLNEGQQLCVVCSDVGNGVHFGALTCEGCKKFFRRGLTENGTYTCKSNNNCVINPQTRNSCRYCRYQKCIKAGMCREAIQMGRPSKLPSSTNVSRNTIDRHQLQLHPSSRILDSSNVEASQLAIERSHAENLSQVLGLQRRPDNWINATFFGHSYANPKTSQSPNLSEEEPIDVENSEDLYCGKCASSHPSSSCSDVTQQPDSTVLSPMEMGHADEPDEPFFVDSASCPRSSAKAKGQFLSRNGIRGSTGDVAVLKDKQRRLSSGEAEGCSGRMPDRLPMRLHNGGKHSSSSCTDTIATGKRQKSNVALLSQEMLASTMLPLLKENGSFAKNFERRVRPHVSVECSTSEQASGSCSSPSITSSFPSEMFKKDMNQDNEGVNSAVSEALENEDSAQGGAVPKRFDIESLVALSRTYWLQPCLPDPNILFAGAKHWDVLNSIVPAYDRFLQMSNTINRTLKAEFEEWSRQVTDPMDNQTYLSDWIKQKVIPAYTIASVTYCKSLPGFSSFHCDDQITIIRLGQSPSRILMAALNWYDADQKNFRNFLSWRDKKPGRLDLFKQKLIEYAEDISSLEVDAIEAALLNVLLILATDYPDLVRADIISDARWKILSTFRAYTTGKCGTPNNRVESLFSHIPELRRLGLLHHMMMTTRTMTAEEVEYLTSGRILDSQMVLSCQQSTGS